MKLSVIVPAYNEEKNLAANIKKYYDYLSCQKYDFEIIIVNDGSTDSTGLIAQELTKSWPNIKLISSPKNHGKGAAIRQGLLAGQGDYRLFIDADGATSIEHIEEIWPIFNQGYQIVIGTRNNKDAPGAYEARPQPVWKRIFGVFGNKIIQLLTVRGIRDTQCGFKAFTGQSADKIFSSTKINRWAIDVEALMLAKRLQYKIGFIPVVWYDYDGSRVKIKDYFLFLKDIILAKYWLMTGKYKLNL
jgi:dolichyl-phosphate beta-glucosyltransferase